MKKIQTIKKGETKKPEEKKSMKLELRRKNSKNRAGTGGKSFHPKTDDNLDEL
jgi:hypothetical protein